MKLSVIIPVYNVEEYIRKCIDSLVLQLNDEMELIFIDDGSPDNSQKIIKEYQKKYKNIRLVVKENGGLSSARNRGLKEARGEYVTFVDSDDFVSDKMIKLVFPLLDDNYDIIVYDYIATNLEDEKRIKSTDGDSREITPAEYVILNPSACNKIYKRQFLIDNNFEFIEKMIYEDYASIPTLAKYNPRVYYLNEGLYYYLHRDNSITRNQTYQKKYEDIFRATKYLYDSLIDNGFNYELEYILTYHFLYLASLNFYEFKKYENIDRVANDMKRYFPKWYRNKLVKARFNKKEMLYMRLFYHKKYFLIDLYRKVM